MDTAGDAGIEGVHGSQHFQGLLGIGHGRPDEGFAVARAIASDPGLDGMKVVLLTGVGDHYDMFFEPDDNLLPVDRVLEKPVEADELVRTIEGLLSADTEGPA